MRIRSVLMSFILVVFCLAAASAQPLEGTKSTKGAKATQFVKHRHLKDENLKGAKAQCGCMLACDDAANACLDQCAADGYRSSYCDQMCSDSQYNCYFGCGFQC
jgi:hypothetical protein